MFSRLLSSTQATQNQFENCETDYRLCHVKREACTVRLLIAFLAALIAFSGDSYAQPVREWLVLGAFPVNSNQNVETEFLSRENDLWPHGGLRNSNRVWKHFQTTTPYLDFLDMDLGFFPVENAVAYACIYVKSPNPDTVTMQVGCDDLAVLRVNGEVAWTKAAGRHAVAELESVEVIFRKGWNCLLFKVMNGVGEWSLYADMPRERQLEIQAEIPDRLTTIPKSDPRLVRVLKFEPGESAILTTGNQPALQFRTVLSNSQQQSLGICKAALFSRAGTQMGESHEFEFHAGMLQALTFTIPVYDLLESYNASGSWQLQLTFAKEEVKRVLPLQYDGRLLGKVLGTFELVDLERRINSGSQQYHRVFFVPEVWGGMPLRLTTDLGEGRGTLQINGEEKLVNFHGHSGDIALSDSAKAGARFEILLEMRAATNGHAPSAEMSSNTNESRPRIYITVEHRNLRRYLTAAAVARQNLSASSGNQDQIDTGLFKALKSNDVAGLDAQLTKAAADLPDLSIALQRVPDVSLVAWSDFPLTSLQRYSDGIERVKAVFEKTLQNFDKYPGYFYTQTQPFALWLAEQHAPRTFELLKEGVATSQLEVAGGAWVEPEWNLLAGESLVRQFLYGQRYLKQSFGAATSIAWSTKCASHPWSLPQVLRKSGITNYVLYQPYEAMSLFSWEGLDGSRILAYRPPADLDRGLSQDEGRYSLISKQKFEWPQVMRPYGGTGEGYGPADREIRLAEDLAFVTAVRSGLPAVPTVRMATARNFFEELNGGTKHWPILREEIRSREVAGWSLQPEYKWQNRRVESLLPIAEAFSLFAKPYGFEYPESVFKARWQQVLFNQSHDLLAGYATAEMVNDARRFYREAEETAKAALDQALTTIESHIQTALPGKNEQPIVVYNFTSWPRTDYVELDVSLVSARPEKKRKATKAAAFTKIPYFRDLQGTRIPVQVVQRDSSDEGFHYRLLFMPTEVPAMGYQVYWLGWSDTELEIANPVRFEHATLALSNHLVSCRFDSASGALLRMVDSQLNREWMSTLRGGLLLSSAPSGLEASEDPQAQWLEVVRPPELIEAGPLRMRLRTRYASEALHILQDYVLYAEQSRLEIHYTVRGEAPRQLLKVALPFYVTEGKATFDIPFGAIARPMNGDEFPMQKWVDISNSQFGVTVLNDGVCSVSLDSSLVRISAARFGEAVASAGVQPEHHFSLAVVPHTGDWRSASVPARAHGFDQPLLARIVESHKGDLPAAYSFVEVHSPQLTIAAAKKAEDDGSWILRLYENTGAATNAEIKLPFSAATVSVVNLTEEDEKLLPLSGQSFYLNFEPWEIKSLKLVPK